MGGEGIAGGESYKHTNTKEGSSVAQVNYLQEEEAAAAAAADAPPYLDRVSRSCFLLLLLLFHFLFYFVAFYSKSFSSSMSERCVVSRSRHTQLSLSHSHVPTLVAA